MIDHDYRVYQHLCWNINDSEELKGYAISLNIFKTCSFISIYILILILNSFIFMNKFGKIMRKLIK